uniref:hypothetical protein n=1 Tax=uncultured Bilophila sp. TaxID=529385 RepID=UPI00267061FF
MNSLPAIKRIYYTAFLYAEYIFRNIEKNYSELVRSVKFFKELIQKNSPHFDADVILDSVLELECYYNSEKYDFELFCGACYRKYCLRPEFEQDNFREYVEFIYDIIQDKTLYPEFQKIVKISLSEGIYITHIDSFRKKKYYYQSIPENLPGSYFLKHIFFKNDSSFWGDAKYIKYRGPDELIPRNEEQLGQEWEHNEGIKLTTKEEYIHDYLSESSLTVFIPPFEGDINLEKILEQIEIAVIGLRLDSIESTLNNYSKYKNFINQFFKKGLYRETKKEFEKKILGLLLYDEYLPEHNFRYAIEKLYKKYNIRINSSCPYIDRENTTTCSCKCVADNECDKKIQHM